MSETFNIEIISPEKKLLSEKVNLAILPSTIIELSDLSKDKISKMIDDGKNLLNQKELDDKKRYIISHKLDCLSRINL